MMKLNRSELPVIYFNVFQYPRPPPVVAYQGYFLIELNEKTGEPNVIRYPCD